MREAGDNRWAGFCLALLLLGTLLKGLGWSLLIFPFDAPDEPSHLVYAMQVRTYHTVPVVVMPDANTTQIPPSTPRDPATLALLALFQYKANDFRTQSYESAQPPLFPAAVALLTAPLDQNRLVLLYAARLVAVLCGVAAVAALWWAGQALWPRWGLLAWGAPLALSLHPQFTFITATLTNDAAILACGAGLLALWAAGLRAAARGPVAHPWHWALAAGVLTGLGLLVKLTMLATLPATLLWLWWMAGPPAAAGGRRRGAALGALVASLGVVTGWWVVRNLLVYGEPTGTRAILTLVRRLLLEAYKLPLDQSTVPFQPDLFVYLSFTSFWSSYGWLTTLLPPWPYWLLLGLSGAALLGGLRALWPARAIPTTGIALARRRFVALAIVTGLTAEADLLAYNIFVDVQPQGRYLFVALAPLLLLLVLGLRHLTPRPAINRAVVLGFLGFLIVLQLWSIPILLDRWHTLNQCLTNC